MLNLTLSASDFYQPISLVLGADEAFLSTFLHQNLEEELELAFLVYFAGVYGLAGTSRNYLISMLAIELMYIGALLAFVVYAAVVVEARASAYALLLMIAAACESAIGLGILVVLYRTKRSVEFKTYNQLIG